MAQAPAPDSCIKTGAVMGIFSALGSMATGAVIGMRAEAWFLPKM